MALFGRRREPPAEPPPVRPLPVPPFAPDPPRPVGPSPFAGDDPAAALAALGVPLGAHPERVQAAADLAVWTVPVDDMAEGVTLWQAVRDRHDGTGLWPVLIDAQFWETTALPGLGEEPEPVEDLDAAVWLTAAAADESWGLAGYGRGEVPPFEAPDPRAWAGRLAEGTDDPDHLLLVPCAGGWEVPGRLGWSGAVNQGPEGDEHTAVLRRWHGQWGAELVAMGLDTVTVRVTRPPTTSSDALAVATEMGLYCADSVFQGVGTIEGLVPTAVSSVWSFWWD